MNHSHPPEMTLRETRDGSHTLMRTDLDESYHSLHGALTESQYVFLDQGLHRCPTPPAGQPVHILEIGLGTGLNVLLTALATASPDNPPVVMVSLEPIPVPESLIAHLNYPDKLPDATRAKNLLRQIHTGPWSRPFPLGDRFTLRKEQTTLEAFDAPLESFDLIYFDAFAPNKQAEIWSSDNLTKCRKYLTPGGLLVTYCAQGQFKRNLKAAGFEVEALAGPPGKKQMTRGWKRD